MALNQPRNLSGPMSVLGQKSRHLRCNNSCRMSALGHKRTFRSAIAMSALPPKADICSATRDVRFVPKADIRPLFDHFIGAQ